MLEYAIVETLNGNFILKPADKVKDTDIVEYEIYAETEEDARRQYKEHMKELEDLWNDL